MFFFLSRRNSTSPRFLPLFDKTKETRIVYLFGSRLPLTDRFTLKIFKFLYYFVKNKIKNYKTLHIFSLGMTLGSCNEVLHLDDPIYTDQELLRIQNWLKGLENVGLRGAIICTNLFTENWLRSNNISASIWRVEQGYVEIENEVPTKNKNFSCVYTSPYIHYGNDKQGRHSTWGAGHLIDVIIPELARRSPDIQIHLIGEIGKNAEKQIAQYKNVVCHGRVDFQTNQRIMRKCHIGIYPRTIDHKRSVQKIFEYIGAALPIVTYDLIDTEIVKSSKIGVSVKSSDKFVDAICEISNDSNLRTKLESRVKIVRPKYSWTELANKMEKYSVSNFFL